MIATDYIFGKRTAVSEPPGEVEFNVFVEGPGASFPTAADFALTLVNFTASDILGYTVDENNNIKCRIEKPYQISDNAYYNVPIKSFFDYGGFCTHVGHYAFGNRDGFTYAYFPGATSTGETVWLSNGIVKRIFISSVTDLGGTSLNEDVFKTINGGVTIYADPYLQTNNGGNPDGDFDNATSRGATLIYAADKTPPEQITDFRWSDSIKELRWYPPVSGVNTLDFYIILRNGFPIEEVAGAVIGGQLVKYNVVGKFTTGDTASVILVDVYGNINISEEVQITNLETQVLELHFEDAIGSTTLINDVGTDVWTQGGDCTLESEGFTGNGIYFNGSNDYVATRQEFGKCFCDGLNMFSFTFRFKPDSHTANGVICGYGGGTGTAANFAIFIDSANHLQVVIRGVYTDLGVVSTASWYFCGMSWDSKQAIMNLDGVEYPLNVGTAPMQNYTPNTFSLGRTSAPTANEYYKGLLDEFRGWHGKGLTFQELDSYR